MRVDPNYVSGLVSSLEGTTLKDQQLSSELSSGLAVTKLSDNPVAAGQASLLGSAISQDDSFVQTAATTQSMMQLTDSALGSVVTQLTTAISVATQGSNGTNDPTDNIAISAQLSNIRDEVVSLANTNYQGSYVFSGSKGNVPPYTLNATTMPATATYNGDTQVGTVTTPGGAQIQTGIAGSAVFSAPGADVIQSLNNLIADFASGTASASAAEDVGALNTALGNLGQQRATLDSSLSRLESVSTYTQTDATEMTAAQGGLMAADTATVATQLSSTETQSQALIAVIATLSKTTNLFDSMS
jgi:flagellar hook-associated protein 3 FlgL